MTVPRLMDLVKEKCTEVYSEARYFAWCKYWHYLRKSRSIRVRKRVHERKLLKLIEECSEGEDDWDCRVKWLRSEEQALRIAYFAARHWSQIFFAITDHEWFITISVRRLGLAPLRELTFRRFPSNS